MLCIHFQFLLANCHRSRVYPILRPRSRGCASCQRYGMISFAKYFVLPREGSWPVDSHLIRTCLVSSEAWGRRVHLRWSHDTTYTTRPYTTITTAQTDLLAFCVSPNIQTYPDSNHSRHTFHICLRAYWLTLALHGSGFGFAALSFKDF